jgi:hypothetical protein
MGIESTKIIRKASEKPRLLASSRYIEAQMNRRGPFQITQQMGPYCTESCGHCYGSYSPQRTGVPNSDTIRNSLEQAVETNNNLGINFFPRICLSDGEPLHEKNRESMRALAEYSSRIPLAIMTNAGFAKSLREAREWMRFLRDSGLDFSSIEDQCCETISSFHISTGRTYNVPLRNHYYFNKALKQIFPDLNFGEHLDYTILGFEDKFPTTRSSTKLVGLIHSLYGTEDPLRITSNDGQSDLCIEFPTENASIFLYYGKITPDGRAVLIPEISKKYPEKPIQPEELEFSPEESESLTIDYQGNVSFGSSQKCVRPGKIYGNVNEGNLFELVRKINHDEYYQATKLGGVRFLYHLAQEASQEFRLSARDICGVCHSIAESPELVEAIRQGLKTTGVVESYKGYLDQRGIPNIG